MQLGITRVIKACVQNMLDPHTGRMMGYRAISYHEISVRNHKPDMAMIAHIKNHTHIST